MIAYINSLESPESPICETIRKEALAGMVPIIRSETASLPAEVFYPFDKTDAYFGSRNRSWVFCHSNE